MSLQEKSLFVAMELSNKNWKLAFGDGSVIRERSMKARDEALLLREVAAAKVKLHLSPDNVGFILPLAGVFGAMLGGRTIFDLLGWQQRHVVRAKVALGIVFMILAFGLAMNW